ncbi:hypothetical protein [Myceligenerans indicum]|uniref:Uncharacterized protein n=1 Tax=Myceligenerans indicum TaxID=2593663 RepID=A0ABS1LLB6_9MICO|nr:hypothetical protein [Myceligenerans indicum]MBL0887026.1 hypothetical protein [Myceligenerans indicum]
MSDGSRTVRESGAEQDGVTADQDGPTADHDGPTAVPVTDVAAQEASGDGPAGSGDTGADDGAAGSGTVDPDSGATRDGSGSSGRTGGGLEEKAAERLHALVERGAEKIPGDQGSMVSRFAVALLSFGSAMTERGRDKEEKGTSALVSDAVQLFKSLDDDPARQREAMERALSDLTSNFVGDAERGKVLDVAQQAMGLWRGARGASSGLAASDDAVSLRSLAGMLRNKGDEEGAAQTEEEASRLEK